LPSPSTIALPMRQPSIANATGTRTLPTPQSNSIAFNVNNTADAVMLSIGDPIDETMMIAIVVAAELIDYSDSIAL